MISKMMGKVFKRTQNFHNQTFDDAVGVFDIFIFLLLQNMVSFRTVQNDESKVLQCLVQSTVGFSRVFVTCMK